MTKNGKTIQIFLPDGDPKHIKKATITTGQIEVIQIPRNLLVDTPALLTSLLNFNGIYILVDTLSAIKPEIYIGKGLVKNRIYQHKNKKDFWTTLFAIRKQSTDFDDAQNRYLEYYFIKEALTQNRAIMHENKQLPICHKVSEAMEADLECYVEMIKTLLSTLGLKCFEPLESVTPSQRFICRDKYGNWGQCSITNEGYLLYKGAICKLDLHKGSSRFPIRDELINKGILIENNGHYVLQENYQFSSPSTAAFIVLGRNANGRTEWKNKEGKTLADLDTIKK